MPLTTYTAGDVLTAASLNANFTFAATNPPGGLSFITGNTFTTVASVSLPNATFSASFANYRVVIVGTAVSTTLNYTMRMRIGGADDTTSNYSSGIKGRTNTAIDINFSSNGASSWDLGASDGGLHPMSVSFDIANPFATSKTRVFGSGLIGLTSNGVGGAVFGALHNTTTSFDSLSLIASTGTISGFFRVYGYADS